MNLLVLAANTSIIDDVGAAFSGLPEFTMTTVETVAEALHHLAEAHETGAGFSLGVVDFDLAGLSGMKGINQLSLRHERKPLALLLKGGSLELTQRAYRAGANGVISKDLVGDDLSNALMLTQSGQYLSVLSSLVHGNENKTLDKLSERELQILRGLCDGMQNKEIAHKFAIQEVTVKMHMRSVVRKLGANNRTHAAMIARDMHLI